MGNKHMNAEAALQEVARRHHVTVEEVRKEIRLAMIAAMCDPDLPYRRDGARYPTPVIRSRRRILLHTLRCSACRNKLTL